jgi:drug/metabolite transporter (DMT)-like permease
VLIAYQQAILLFISVRTEVRKSLNSLMAGQLFGGVLFLIGVVLAIWSYNNDQLMGQLFGGVLILIGIILAALAYNKRRRFVGTHGKGSPEAVKPA